MTDLDKLANDIRALCNGHPHAKIAWPHRELHDLADRAQALARRDGVEEPVAWRYRYPDDPTWQLTLREKQARDKTGEVQPLYAQPAPTAPGDGERAAILSAIGEAWRAGFGADETFDCTAKTEALLVALRQPDTAAVTADTVRNTITRFLTADDPTHWGEFEKRLAVAVGMTPSTAEDACMAGGWPGGDEFMVGPRGALLASIAISAKRIADALERLDPERPLNAYGETIGECIQGQHERGLRGIPNP
jgi:hypothetical protein